MKYVHTNIIAKDWKKLARFYEEVFGMKQIGHIRDHKGQWIDELVGIKEVNIRGVHLVLPGYEDEKPTLEIFSYNETIPSLKKPNSEGFSHIAFEVEDVKKIVDKLINAGGTLIGKIVKKEYENGKIAIYAYAKDIENNIVEIQSWNKA